MLGTTLIKNSSKHKQNLTFVDDSVCDRDRNVKKVGVGCVSMNF